MKKHWHWYDITQWFKPRRHTIAHHRLPCATCGREIAHTQAGKVYPHKCLTPQTVETVWTVEHDLIRK